MTDTDNSTENEIRRRIIIAGSRDIRDYGEVAAAMTNLLPRRSAVDGQYEIVSGGARGVDTLGEQWAERHDCPVREYDPTRPEETETDYSVEEWGEYAFIKRNQEMVDYVSPGGLLVAIWDGESPGTRRIIEDAVESPIDMYVRKVVSNDD